MRIQLLIASQDSNYTGHLSSILAENHADAINVSICSDADLLREQLITSKYDIALMEATMIGGANMQSVALPLLLWSEEENAQSTPEECKKIRKYQRISLMVSEMLEIYAKGAGNEHGSFSKKARITAVWSPAGGVGKTTTALAYSAGKTSY